MTSNIYLALTRQFNRGRLRAVLAGGQAMVLHRLAMMSKDGDWVLREEEEALQHVLRVLEKYGARYRFCAPLDGRWLTGGWSSHFEFAWRGLRIRTDFVTRPPRLTSADLARFWAEHAGEAVPFAGARDLAEMKKTSREKDYAAIGELARLMPDTRARILQSRSARDLLKLAAGHRALFRRLSARRPALAAAVRGLTALEAALDRERRELIHADEKRLARYAAAAAPWAAAWPKIEREMVGRPLREAHAIMVERAAGILPLRVPEETP